MFAVYEVFSDAQVGRDAHESARKFVHYIAESQRQAMHSGCLSVKHFFSCLMDGSTDKGKVEN